MLIPFQRVLNEIILQRLWCNMMMLNYKGICTTYQGDVSQFGRFKKRMLNFNFFWQCWRERAAAKSTLNHTEEFLRGSYHEKHDFSCSFLEIRYWCTTIYRHKICSKTQWVGRIWKHRRQAMWRLFQTAGSNLRLLSQILDLVQIIMQ